ncbi:MAG: type 1 glutamine amidotransferase [Hydrogenophilaceae bacterium]|nr:type 1 glutamine amidotransferase [Hydrogenophilaceae bacterium]
MKPVAIFRHTETEGPGTLADFLDRHRIPYSLIRIDAGEPVPDDPAAFSGLAFMGGPMSVNDDLPWIPRSLRLIRHAVDHDIPVLGHCLGGQLMAKALGGTVGRNPVKEIGWGTVQVLDRPEARTWFGDIREFESFHWHGETFSIPEGAVRILESHYCANQAFILDKHLAMQCHVEMTEAMIRTWCDNGAAEIAQSPSPAVQAPETILARMPQRLPQLNQVADRLYRRWIEGLARA